MSIDAIKLNSTKTFQTGRVFAQSLDASDPLRGFRERFNFPQHEGKPVAYFTGNSLGLQPKDAVEIVNQELQDWATFGVEGHFEAKRKWVSYHEQLAEPAARLVGAKPEEVVHMNSLTVNLHLLMVSFYRPVGKRRKILIEKGAFPSDQYAVSSQIQFHGHDPKECLVEAAPRAGETNLRDEDLLQLIHDLGEELALILIGGVNYYTGQVFDFEAITNAGHAVGAVVGFDLAHAAGNVPLKLHDWDVDFAAWCTYKYLNAGPGAIGGVFVHERFANRPDLPRFAGWWGHDKVERFQMLPVFKPMQGAEGWQLSNPPVLAMAPLVASLALFDEAGHERRQAKTRQLTAYLAWLVAEANLEGLTNITPERRRGCQISLRTLPARPDLVPALLKRGVVTDWRHPDVVRVAPVPLYTSYEDVFTFVETLKKLW
jgi:kynureninase